MTPDIKKILYATDLSANSVYALRHALHSAKRYHAEIIIMHTLESPYIGYAPILSTYIDDKGQQMLHADLAAEAKAAIEKRLKAACNGEPDQDRGCVEMVTSIEVCEGFPAERILETAQRFDCDLIIMGTHGKGIIGTTFLGSTAKRVLRRTRVPIYIVPLPKGESDDTIQELDGE
jgi:nucleotide-binding universal stress UspA family protein